MPRMFDPKRYTAPASQVEDLAYGGELPPPLPARPSAATQTLAAPIARTDLAGATRGPGPYGAPLTRQQIAERGQQRQAQQNMITQAGASAAGQQLGDVKASPEYRTASAALDAIRQKYGSNREGMFQDPEYKQVTRQMASILSPVDQARMAAIRQTRDVYARANGGFNEADLAAQAVPATVEQWKAGTGQIIAQTGALDAQGNLLNANAGKVTEEAAQVGANAQSARGVQDSQAGLNKAQADILPKKLEAEAAGNQETRKAQGEAMTYKQKVDELERQNKALQAQQERLIKTLQQNGVEIVLDAPPGGNGGQAAPSPAAPQAAAPPQSQQGGNGSAPRQKSGNVFDDQSDEFNQAWRAWSDALKRRDAAKTQEEYDQWDKEADRLQIEKSKWFKNNDRRSSLPSSKGQNAGAGGGRVATTQPSSDPQVKSMDDYNRLPSGATYIDPNGNRKVKR